MWFFRKRRLAELIANGQLQKARQKAERLFEEVKRDLLSDEIADAFGRDRKLFQRFVSLPQAKKREMLLAMLPYVLRMMGRWRRDVGTRLLFGASIALGFYDIARAVAEELMAWGRSEHMSGYASDIVSVGIANAFGRYSTLFHYFAHIPREKQRKMLRIMFPYARKALRKGKEKWELGMAYLLGASIALDFPDVTTTVINELVKQGTNRALTALVHGFNIVFGGKLHRYEGFDGTLLFRFASLPRRRQKQILRNMLPYALRADDPWGVGWVLAVAIALDLPELAVELTEKLLEQREEEKVSQEIAKAFGSVLFSKLPRDRQLALWHLMLPYAVKLASQGEPAGLEVMLQFYNPIPATWRRWVSLFDKIGDLIAISPREEFWKAIAFPCYEYLEDAWRFTPEEYAGIVVSYVRAEGHSKELIEVILRAVAQRPELAQGIINLAEEFPDELGPMAQTGFADRMEL